MKDLRAEVSKALTIFERSLIYQRDRVPLDREMVDVWTIILESAGVHPDAIAEGVMTIVKRDKFFPTPADLIESCRPIMHRMECENLTQLVMKQQSQLAESNNQRMGITDGSQSKQD